MGRYTMKKTGLRIALCIPLLCVLFFALPAAAEECDHSDTVQISEYIYPTCTRDGYRPYFRCNLCGEILGGNTLPAIGHNYRGQEWKIVRPATCANVGQKQRECWNCMAADRMTIPRKTYHTDYGGNQMDELPIYDDKLEPTCTRPGKAAVRQCPTCGMQQGGEEIPSLGHSLEGGEWTVLEEPTCTNDGRMALSCARCGEWAEFRSIAKDGSRHIWEQAVAAQEPTCTEYGYTAVYQCALCKETEGGERLDYRHLWDAWTVVTPGTCQERGTEQRACKRCQATQTRDAYTHGEIVYTVVTQPTCATPGSMQGTCPLCNAIVEKEIPATGHSFTVVAMQRLEPTCIADGMEEMRSCSVCGQLEGRQKVIPALGHDVEGAEWHLVQEATCTLESRNGVRCSRCWKIVESQVTGPALGHDLEGVERTTLLPATCTRKGKSGLLCNRCGEALDIASIPALGHDLEGVERTTVIPAGCVLEGMTGLCCKRCGEACDTASIPALGHDLVGAQWVTLQEPTCEDEGYAVLRCPRCDSYLEYQWPDPLGHSLEGAEWQTVTEPTCTNSGYAELCCTRCGTALQYQWPDPLGHDFTGVEWEYMWGPNGCMPGVYRRICQRCNFIEYMESPGSVAHTWTVSIPAVAPTCTKSGATATEVCSVCNYQQGGDYIAPLGHDTDNSPWITDPAPTCVESGLAQRYCSRCGKVVDSLAISATGDHSWVTDSEATVTCTQDGYTAAEHCSVCGLKIGGEYQIALGHDIAGWFIQVPATCAQSGLRVKPCMRCGVVIEEKSINPTKYHTDAAGNRLGDGQMILLASGQAAACTVDGTTALYQCPTCDAQIGGERIAAGHTWGDWQVIVESACAQGGSRKRICAVCGAEESEETGFSHAWNVVSATAPTCDAGGLEQRVCALCGVEETSAVPALGHRYDDNLETIWPTCGHNGKVVRYCMVCGHEELLRTLPATGEHDLVTIESVPPTCCRDGLIIRRCMVCGYEPDPQIRKAYGHNFEGQLWTIARRATCASEGMLSRWCMNCGIRETRATDKAILHTDAYGDVLDELPLILNSQPATCTEPGINGLRQCPTCGAYAGGEEIPALGHDMRLTVIEHLADTGEVRETHTCARCGVVEYKTLHAEHHWSAWAADPDNAQQERRVCADCGAAEIRQLDQASLAFNGVCASGGEHDIILDAVISAPNCITAGVSRYRCVKCGDSKDVETAPLGAVGHVFANNVLEIDVPPTCVSDGHALNVCDICGEAVEQGCVLVRTGIHDWQTETAAVAATCTEPGTTEKLRCASCGIHMGGDIVDALGHDFSAEWTVLLASTCAADGQSYRECARCGERETKVLSATGEHEWTVTQQKVEPTCTAEGHNQLETCAVCGAERGGEVLAISHLWSVWDCLRIATCEQPALYRRTCDLCGATDEKTVDSAHQWAAMQEMQPTCTQDGYTMTKCMLCDKTEIRVIPAFGHSPGNWLITEPTCVREGVMKCVCTICNEILESRTYSEATNIHDFVVVDPATPPTCTADGTKAISKCMICGMQKGGETIPATGHSDLGMQWIIWRKATCTAEGTMARMCSFCNMIIETQMIPALAHEEAIDVPAVPATCTETGRTAGKYCVRCGKELCLPETAPALGHDIVVRVAQAATADTNGLEERLCTRCDLYDSRQLPATGKILSLPALLTEVEEDAFVGIAAHGVTVPDSVTTIGAHAFENCAGLVEVRMPDSVTSIGDKAFDGCPDLWFLCESDNFAADYARRNGIRYLIEE